VDRHFGRKNAEGVRRAVFGDDGEVGKLGQDDILFTGSNPDWEHGIWDEIDFSRFSGAGRCTR